jgi:hypothetical protein
LRAVTGLRLLEEIDDAELDDGDAKRKMKRTNRRFDRLLCLQIVRRSLSPFCIIPGSPREVGKSNSPVALQKRRRLGSLLIVFSMAVAATIWSASGQEASRGSPWSAFFLTRLRGRRIESVSRAKELLLLRPSGGHRSLRPSTVYLPAGSEIYEARGDPHYGGLNIRILEEEGEARRIYRDWTLWEGKYDRKRPTDDTNDYYYSLDDDDMRNTYRGWEDDSIHKTKRCRRTSWHRNIPVNCNAFHELDVRTAALHRGFRRVGYVVVKRMVCESHLL